MTIQINYKTSNSKKVSSNLVLFVDEKFNISGLKKNISSSELLYISDLLKNSDLKKDLLVFKINSKKTIFLVSIKKDIKTSDIENLGAKFHRYINYNKKSEYFVNTDTVNSKIKNFAGFNDIPPVSKQTPLPTKAKGFVLLFNPFHSIVTRYEPLILP